MVLNIASDNSLKDSFEHKSLTGFFVVYDFFGVHSHQLISPMHSETKGLLGGNDFCTY